MLRFLCFSADNQHSLCLQVQLHGKHSPARDTRLTIRKSGVGKCPHKYTQILEMGKKKKKTAKSVYTADQLVKM